MASEAPARDTNTIGKRRGEKVLLKGEEAIGSFILSFKQDEEYVSQVDTRHIFYQCLNS